MGMKEGWIKKGDEWWCTSWWRDEWYMKWQRTQVTVVTNTTSMTVDEWW
jgi:hypothetical protein